MTQPGGDSAGSWLGYGGTGGNNDHDASGGQFGGREPGARRKMLKGYLTAANELRKSYQQSYATGWGNRDAEFEQFDGSQENAPGAFPDAAVVRNGNEEMILFPSYARKHIKQKPQAAPGTIQQATGSGRDVRDSSGEGDAEFWRQQWEQYEDDNAVVDVDVRGWIYAPHRGPLTRKNRLFVGLARQLVGLPSAASNPSPGSSAPGTRDSSPHRSTRERLAAHAAKQEEEQTAREAESILRKGEAKAEVASKGGYSEPPGKTSETGSVHNVDRRNSSPLRQLDGSDQSNLRQVAATNAAQNGDQTLKSAQDKRNSWNQPANMTSAEIAAANSNLMARLKPFLAYPMANTPISAFFYNETVSRQRTIYTNSYGHFALRASLDFIPSHVRILASERLSASEEVIITDPNGISLISDIDDTIKHSAIGSGAREIFRNAFIRELDDLTIEGVREWYSAIENLGVKFHYVSNSPWQLYPVLTSYFAMAGLPNGSFHLKQYSGMLQGIFEPVAERKKSTLDRIARDFPERRFILVGDSGEADLEVYTDFVLENPGRVIAIFVRDVTTTSSHGPHGFFDPSVSSPGDERRSVNRSSTWSDGASESKAQSLSDTDDPDLKAAIHASLLEFDKEQEKRPPLPPRRKTQPAKEEKLIDFSDDESAPPTRAFKSPTRSMTDYPYSRTPTRGESQESLSKTKSGPPAVPKKPPALRSSSDSKKPPPPRPVRPSSSVHRTPSQSLPATPQKEAFANYTAPPPPPPQSRTQTLKEQALQTVYRAAPLERPQARRDLSTQPTSSIDKRQQLWKQRWDRAEQTLRRSKVTLRSWRVGTDVMDECVRLVRKAQREYG